MAITLNYAMKFVADMDAAVKFYRDTLGFTLKFESPGWTEFVTGETTLSLHWADAEHPAGGLRLGLRVPDLRGFCERLTTQGVVITRQPELVFGALIAEFLDSEGSAVNVSEERTKAS